MKKFTFLLIAILATVCIAVAQVPSAFNYQTVVRNSSGEVLANQSVSFKISILLNSATGTAKYVEKHSATTNDFGLVNLKIGNGTVVSGSFTPSNWGSNSHFVKVEIDVNGGSSYTHMGTSQLSAVPYAFHAKTVENDAVNDADADASNELQTISLSGTQLTLSDGGGTVTLPSSGGGDNWGTQTVVSNSTLKGIGTTASPLAVSGDLTDNQTLSISGKNLSISGGNTVALPVGGSSLWTANGSNIYYNSGKVGIGTTSPYYSLAINAKTTHTYATFQNNNSGTTTSDGFLIGINTSGKGYMWNYENDPIYFGTNNVHRMSIDADGDVTMNENLSVDKEVHTTSTGTANMLPIAYGTVGSTGILYGKTGNVSSTKIATGKFQITITGVSYSSSKHVTCATMIYYPGSVTTSGSSGKLIVYTRDSSGALADRAFCFIVYQP